MATGTESQQVARNLKETLSSYQQEVQDTHAWLQRTYAALDEQASQAGHEGIDRYLLNNTLLAQLFSGPGPLPEPPGGRKDVTEVSTRLRESAAGSEAEQHGGAGDGAPEEPFDKDAAEADLQDFMDLLERIRTANTEAELEECKREYEQQTARRRKRRAEQEPGAAEKDVRKRAMTLVAPGVHKVELFDDEHSWSSGGDSPIRL